MGGAKGPARFIDFLNKNVLISTRSTVQEIDMEAVAAKATLSDQLADLLIWVAELPVLGEYIICPIIAAYALLHGTDMDN